MTLQKQFEYLERDIRSRERRGEITHEKAMKEINHLWHVEYQAAMEIMDGDRNRMNER